MNQAPKRGTAALRQRPANAHRRLLGRAGLSGTAVLLTTASRSALGGWGQCTGSELASGNLSRMGTLNPCGCSPGYWKSSNQNGTRVWNDPNLIPAIYGPNQGFNCLPAIAMPSRP